MQRVRLTVDIPRWMADELDRKGDEDAMHKSDIVRRALEWHLLADQSRKDGFKVGAWMDDGKKRIEREFSVR